MKMKFAGAVALTLALAAAANIASAKEQNVGWEGSVHASTLGMGVEFKRYFSTNFAGRVTANSYNYSINDDISNVRYKGDLKLKSFGAIVDYHPGGHWFRVSAGVVFNKNEIAVDAAPSSGTFKFNGVVYTANQIGTAKGNADFKKVAPYFGIGFARARDSGVAVSADLGVIYQGKTSFTLKVTCAAAVPAQVCTQLQSDADAERTAFEDDASKYKFFPVIGVSIGYRW